MKLRIGLAISFLIVAFQWLIVLGFVAHSYTWLLKANDPVVTAGIVGTVLFTIGSAAVVAYSLWAHKQLYEQKSRLQYFAQLLAVACLSGLLVFFGMVAVGYVLLVHR